MGSTTEGIDADARHGARDLVVLRDGPYVFRKVVEDFAVRVDRMTEVAQVEGLLAGAAGPRDVLRRHSRRMPLMIARLAEHLTEIRTLAATPGRPWIRRISPPDFVGLPRSRP